MTPFAQRFQKQIRFLQDRFSRKGYAGLHLTIGVLVVLLSGWCFGAIAEDVSNEDPIVQIDARVTLWFHQETKPPIISLARGISFFGSVGWITVVSLGLALFFVWRRHRLDLSLLALTILGGSTLNLVLKHLFHRERPALENPLVTLSSFGFPSGHTMGSTLLYGLLALFAWRNLRDRSTRLICVFSACLWILLIGFTRIYLGAHYLSDVIGALAAGLLWLTFCWTGIDTLRRRRPAR
jgi:membrane-associated phospholipid phosphatase